MMDIVAKMKGMVLSHPLTTSSSRVFRILILTGILFQILLSLIVVSAESDTSGLAQENKNETEIKNYTLTGIPQIDYVHDPNLPRELNGYNLSDYPFFNKIPKNLNFSCDGLKDGFYASVPHKCQLYHHCLFGTRYDFLCANYTAFDQRTFICQFVSEVDCPNSALFFHRNEALYKTETTTTPAPVIVYVGLNGRRIRPATVQKQNPVSFPPPDELAPASVKQSESERLPVSSDDTYDEYPLRYQRKRRRCGPRGRRRCRRPRPRPDYYDYYEYDDYYEPRQRQQSSRQRELDYDYEDPPRTKGRQQTPSEEEFTGRIGGSGSTTPTTTSTFRSVPLESEARRKAPQPDQSVLDPETIVANREKIFSKSRAPPKIRPPVPIQERAKYNGIQGRVTSETSQTPSRTTTSTAPPPTPHMEYEDYYDDEIEMATLPPSPPTTYRSRTTSTTTTTTTTTTPSTPQYEYEYDDYEESIPPVTTTTTLRSVLPLRRTTYQPEISSEEALLEEMKSQMGPGLQHQKINEALEAPSKASLRIPYHNKPRPNFLRNSHMLLPVTTARTTTSPTTVRPTTPFPVTFDGMNRRFPIFDNENEGRLPLETVLAAAPRQRPKPDSLDISNRRQQQTTPIVQEEYMGFQEADMTQGRYHKGESENNDDEQTYYQRFTSSRSESEQVPRQRIDLGQSRSRSPSPSRRIAQRSEYISLIPEDEESTIYGNRRPNTRMQIMQNTANNRGLTSQAQEIIPQYLLPPRSYSMDHQIFHHSHPPIGYYHPIV